MAFDKQTENAFLTLTLVMALNTFPVIATTNIDCNGKAFYCVNSTHFKICVDFGGVSKTVDDFLIACPPSTVCSENNYFECEYPVSTTSATVLVQSDVTNEFTEKTTPSDLFEVTTYLPVNNHEKSIEFADQWTQKSIEPESKAEATETTVMVNNTPVILDTKNILDDTTLSESANNSPKPIDLFDNSEFSTTAAIGVIKDNLSAITTGATTVDHTRAESELLNDSLNTIVTTPSNKAHTENLTLTKIISPTIIDYLSTKSLSSDSYLSSDLTKTVITTPRNNVGNEYFISTTSLVSTENVGDLSSNNSLAEVINKVTESDKSIDLLKTDITASTPNLEKVESNTESVINHTTAQNVVKESNISDVTMAYDSYILSTQQYITVNPISETVTDANEFLIYDEIETSRDRLNDSDVFDKLDDISIRTTKADTDQTELDPTTDNNVTLTFTADGFSLKKYLFSQLVDVDFLKAETITTLSDLYDSATSKKHVTIQKSTETSLNLPTPKTNDVTKSYDMVNTNNEIAPITLSPLAISESHLVSGSIFKSSTNEIRASADFYEEIGEDNQLNNMTETNKNVLTTVATALSDFYTNIGQNSSRVGVNDLLVQDQQITAGTDINSQTTTTTTVYTSYADIKDNNAQIGISDLLTQSQKNMTEADINLLTTTPTNVDHLNIINNTFQVWVNTLFTQSQQNMTETAINSITTTKPTVGDFYTDIINNSSQIGVTAILMQSQAASTEEETETDVNFLTTTKTNVDEYYSNIVNNTSQFGARASFTQNQHEMTETDMNFQTTTISNVDNFYKNVINYTAEVRVLDLLMQNQRNMKEADVNFLTTTVSNVDEFYSNIANNTAQDEVNALFLQNQQNMSETDIIFLPTTIPTEGDFYTNIRKNTSQAGQKNMTDVNFLLTTPTNSDYLNITNKTSQVWTLFTQSQQSMTEADINLLTTTATPNVGDFYKDIINNTSQLGVTNTHMQSKQSMSEADINLLTTITTPNVGDSYTDITNNTSQLGVTNTYKQSQQSMTEADINLLTTTTTPTAGDFYTDVTNNTSPLGVTNTRKQSQQSMTEEDINLLTTTATPTAGDFYTDITNNTSQLGVTNTRKQSQQSTTEADINLLTTPTPSVGDFYTDIISNTYGHTIEITDIRMQSQQSMTEDNNLLTTTTSTADSKIPKITSGVEAKDNLFMQSRQNVTESDKDFLTTSTAAVEKFYADVGKNTSHVEVNDLYIHENIASDLPNAKFSAETNRNNDLLDTTTAVNAVLKDIKGLSDDIKKSGNVEFTTPMSPSDISLTITTESYVGNTQKSSNIPDYFTELFKKINNDTSQGLHETSTNKDLIDKITVPLSPHVDFISTNKTHTYSDNYDFTTTTNIALNTTADEFTMKALPTKINDIRPITNNALTNPNTTDFLKVNTAVPSLPTKNIQYHSTTTIADGVHSDVTIKDDYEGIKESLLQENDNKSTTLIFFNTSEHDIDTIEPETIDKPDIYGKTEQTDTELIKTQRILDHLLFSTTTTEEIAIFDNSITELARNESDTFNEQTVSEYQLNRVEPVNDDTQIANRDQDVNNANTNITVTWKPQRDTSNDTFQDLVTSKVGEITGTKITPTEFQNQPNNEAGFNIKNILTSHAYTVNGTDVNTNFTNLDISISKATLRNVTEPLKNKIETDRVYSGISNNIISYLSTESLNNKKIDKNESPENITESSIPVSNNLEKPQIMLSGVENITITVTNKNVDFKTNKSSTKGSDVYSATSKNMFTKPSINIIHTISGSEDLNNIKSILQTNVTELPFTTPLKAFVTTAKPRPVISNLLFAKNKSNTLITTFQLREIIINNTKLEKDMKNLTNEETSGVKVSNRLLEIVKINTTKNDMNNTMKEIAASIPQTNSTVTKNVNLVARPTLLTKKLSPQVLLANSKNTSDTFNTSKPRLILKEQLSNINAARDDQKNSNDNCVHKTVNIDNASKNVSKNNLTLKDPMVTMQDKTTEQTTKMTFDLTNKNGLFSCSNRFRGKYSDKNDCQNFYICIGRYDPIYGKCPNNTVFSEITKQCTRNLSHCIRNNQFKCISPGRYIDIFSDQFYYICVPKAKGYLRFKLKCQKGYHLDKVKLQCILDSCNGSRSSEDSSKNDSDSSKKSTAESKSSKSKEVQLKFLSKQQADDFDCKKEGKFEYPDDCRKYYVCTRNGKSGFKRKIKECDSDEVFDSKKRKCVDDDSYECKR